MSSLQKFHRRTNGGIPLVSPFTTIGSGNDTIGYWLGNQATGIKLIAAPKSTELLQGDSRSVYGGYGTLFGVSSTTDGLSNSITLASLGSSTASGCPAAYYCRNLSTGGYNSWYLPVNAELITCYSNSTTTPFVTTNSFAASNYWTSTEIDSYNATRVNMGSGVAYTNTTKKNSYYTRAVRRSTI